MMHIVIKASLRLQEVTIGYAASTGRSELATWSDSNFADDPLTMRSVAGVVVVWQHSLLLWRSVKLPDIVKCTTSAEYVAASMASDEIVFIRNLLFQLGVHMSPTVLYVDTWHFIGILSMRGCSGKIWSLSGFSLMTTFQICLLRRWEECYLGSTVQLLV
jgi:hypothetical protein